MRSPRLHGCAIASLTMTSLLFGCDARQTGERAQIVFAYTSFDDTTNFNKPIAVGAKLDLRALELATDEEVLVERAKGDDTIAVGEHVRNLIELKAQKPGSTRLHVIGQTQDGHKVEDFVTLRAAEVKSIALNHLCTDSAHAVYQAGLRDVEIPMTKFAHNDEYLIGYGLYPIKIEPAAGAKLDTRSDDAHTLHLDLSPKPGRFEIKSTLNAARLSFELITPAQIDGIQIDEFDARARTVINHTAWLGFAPTYKGKPLCASQTPIEATSLTPKICEVTTILDRHQRDDGTTIQNTEGLIKIKGKAFGVCRYEVNFPGTKAPAYKGSLEVGQFPSDLKEQAKPEDAQVIAQDLIESEDPLARNTHTLHAAPARNQTTPWWLAPLLALLSPLLLAPLWFMRLKRARK